LFGEVLAADVLEAVELLVERRARRSVTSRCESTLLRSSLSEAKRRGIATA
jgi:hypothetical protein